MPVEPAVLAIGREGSATSARAFAGVWTSFFQRQPELNQRIPSHAHADRDAMLVAQPDTQLIQFRVRMNLTRASLASCEGPSTRLRCDFCD